MTPYDYDINVLCDIGKQFPRYFEVTPSVNDIGEHIISFIIKNNNNAVLGQKQVILKVVSISSQPQNLGILLLGASCTAGGSFPWEFKRRLTQSGGSPSGSNFNNISFVGRNQYTQDGLTVNYEATGGFNYNSYLSNSKLFVFNFDSSHQAGNVSINDVYTDGVREYTITEINLTSGVGNISGRCNSNVDIFGSGTLTLVSGSGSQTLSYSSSGTKGNPFVYNNSINIARYAELYGQIDIVFFELSCNGT